MSGVSDTKARLCVRTPKPGHLDRLARRGVLQRLGELSVGRLDLAEGRHCRTFGERSAAPELTAVIRVHDPRFFSEVAFGGSIGAGEAFMLGYWSSDDLTRVIRILLRNRAVLDRMDGGLARLTKPVQRVLHWINRNTRRGSRRNIAAHYDLGNEFFSLWLDRKMMYSSAVFERPGMTLDDASTAKLARICNKLQLTAADRVLEIGTGWGGFSIYAANHFGCHVTTTTISRQQYDFTRRRVRQLGLQDHITVLFDDYRDLRGCYDKLVSIEMIEAVGYRFQPLFFRKCAELLRPDGMMLLQSITIADQRYERAKRSVDFIQRHVFPGGCLTSVTSMLQILTRETDMRVASLEDFGSSYAETLQHWRQRLFQHVDRVRAMGYPDEFIRLWHYYFGYCEGAFRERATGVVQMLLFRPECRQLRDTD